MNRHHPWTMAYWYAVGRNDERAGHPRNQDIPDYVDPVKFADFYTERQRAFRDEETHFLACIPDQFHEFLEETANAR